MKIISWAGSLGNQISSYIFYRWIELNTGEECIYDILPYNYILIGDVYILDLYRLFPNAKKSRRVNEFYPGAETDIINHIKKHGHNELSTILFKHFGREILLLKSHNNSTRIRGLENFFKQIYFISSIYDYAPGIAAIEGDVHYNVILYQNRCWYDDISKIIEDEFEFSRFEDSEINSEYNKQLYSEISEKQSVALHFRIFENRSFDSMDSVNFIKESINFIKERVNSAVFFVFSNYPDIFERDYARHIFDEGEKYAIVRGNDAEMAFRDFQLCSVCKHFILTNNSSFGYYAALLSKSKGKIICQSTSTLSKL